MALEALEALAHEPLDFAVTAARIASASLLWTRGERAEAEATLQGALTAWHTQQRVSTPAPGLQEDVAAIRSAVFLPRGGGIYEGSGWNAFDWSDTGKAVLHRER